MTQPIKRRIPSCVERHPVFVAANAANLLCAVIDYTRKRNYVTVAEISRVLPVSRLEAELALWVLRAQGRVGRRDFDGRWYAVIPREVQR